MKGISIAPVVGIVFIILRMCRLIAWPWLWVFAPFWVQSAIAFIVILIATAWLAKMRGGKSRRINNNNQ